MSTPARQAAINAYRNLLKTQKEVFASDARAIQAAKKETYARFMQFKDETNTDVLDEKLALADQVVSLLRQNVVQGVSNDGNTFQLRITKDTELGDNESVKQPRRDKKASATACCGGH